MKVLFHAQQMVRRDDGMSAAEKREFTSDLVEIVTADAEEALTAAIRKALGDRKPTYLNVFGVAPACLGEEIEIRRVPEKERKL